MESRPEIRDESSTTVLGDTPCLACDGLGSRRIVDQQKDRNFLLLECCRCGLIRLEQLPEPKKEPSAAVSVQALDTFSSLLHGLNTRLILKPEIRRVKRYVSGNGPVLDVGCGTGWAAAMWKRYSGMEVHGLEFQPSRAEMASSRYGLRVLKGKFEEFEIPENFYSLVIIRHVLEHFPDPARVLGNVCRILKPGGHVLIIVPNGRGLGRRIFGRYWIWGSPEHVYTFSPVSLGHLLRKIGFEIAWVIHSPSPVLLSGSLNNWLKCHGRAVLAKYVHQGSILSNVLFFPVALVGKLFHRGEVITVLAQKGRD